MSDTMRAALDDGNGTVSIHQVPMPHRFPGSALVAMRQIGICGSDLHMNNERSEPQSLPSGHEPAGEVLEVPPGEVRIRPGDRVAIETIGSGKACEKCYYCRTGQYRHCIDKAAESGGAFAEFITRTPLGLHKLADDMSWQDGALVEPLAVSVHAVRWGGLRPGDTVAVVGSATIGLAAIAAARSLGARKIVASARYPQQKAMAEACGADMVVGSEPGELEDAARSMTDGLGADVSVETVGGNSIAPLETACGATRSQGTVIIVGGFRGALPYAFLPPMLSELTFKLSSCYGIVDGKHDYDVAIDLLSRKDTGFNEIVTHTVSLDEIENGFDLAYDKTSGSVKVHVTV
ncbi:MAG: zinc-binding dehydrogenase [Chloroflexi bacterium]|nr:zinc-binding dehydrogenase [Chloroflexota bacterium]